MSRACTRRTWTTIHERHDFCLWYRRRSPVPDTQTPEGRPSPDEVPQLKPRPRGSMAAQPRLPALDTFLAGCLRATYAPAVLRARTRRFLGVAKGPASTRRVGLGASSSRTSTTMRTDVVTRRSTVRRQRCSPTTATARSSIGQPGRDWKRICGLNLVRGDYNNDGCVALSAARVGGQSPTTQNLSWQHCEARHGRTRP